MRTEYTARVCGNCIHTPAGALTAPSRYALCDLTNTIVRVRSSATCEYWELRP